MKRFSSLSLPAFAVAAACALLSPIASQAGTTTGALAVSATIANNCVFGTSTLPFGNYDPVVVHNTTPLAVTGTVNLTCTKSDAITLTSDAGANGASASGTCATATCTRAMKSGTNFLSYDLYTTVAHTTIWNGANNIPATGTGASQAVSVFGYIPADSVQPAGAYTDTVTVTATF
ncbi:MAG TPA: spore coat U domain-containing protein [Candidatus Acidoferrales bacterium]|nr:spore coat U domain-containing protein [Candidatus Acidoferrales bacterium]